MSACKFIASDIPLVEFAPSQKYSLHIDVDSGTIDDGGADVIEFWHVWLMDYYELEDRPFIHRKTISISELTVVHIKEIDNADIWNIPDNMFPERPSFYCLTIAKDVKLWKESKI